MYGSFVTGQKAHMHIRRLHSHRFYSLPVQESCMGALNVDQHLASKTNATLHGHVLLVERSSVSHTSSSTNRIMHWCQR